ncbi:MAG: demethoxyubiquinone hydroxylase family protein [Defluviicoccus sp.]|nr:demethoxyubiquinone hydroxylase family protein [Defluviicoccus sp.]MDE0386460.1 demethoxyubiquinone hydroxylase family protein [Defluviicoccus sp.]
MSKRLTAEDRLPGDPDRAETVARMIRVDQAGEYGAVRIYAGQRAFLPRGAAADAVDKMAAKEAEHLAAFDAMVAERGVRPTALMPLWHLAGYALGAATALMGERAAMACTEAIEEVIDRHYAEQSAALGEDEAELRATIDAFRADEIEHRDLAVAHAARDAPGYRLLTDAVKTGSRLAIWLSTRV